MHLHLLIQTYGYWAVFFGTFLEGDTVLAIGGFLSHQRYLAMPLVILIGSLAALMNDQLFFWLGRKKGEKICKRIPRWQPKIELINKEIDKHGNWVAVVFRFVYGFRMVTPFVLGNSRMPYLNFTALNLLGVFIWATVITSCGHLFGSAISLFLSHMRRYELKLILFLILIVVIIKIIESFEIKKLK
jgi:membrane protein DedA with SNARE-associated domain